MKVKYGVDDPVIDEDGNKIWLNEYCLLHRLDGPAVERTDGYKAWYVNGGRHRLDGPAIEFAEGGKHWYIEGKKYTEEEFLSYTALLRFIKKET